MPYAPASACRIARCPNVATRRGYCATHSPDKQRPSAARRGYSTRTGWPEVRLATLAMRPFCEAEGCRALASEVHHVVRLRDGGTHDPSNLMALCHACHSRETARQDAGFGRRGAA